MIEFNSNGSRGKSPLRVGIQVSSLEVPQWIAAVVRQIQQSDFATLTFIFVSKHQALAGLPAAFSRGNLLYALYRRLDRIVFPVKLQPAEQIVQLDSVLHGGDDVQTVRMEHGQDHKTHAELTRKTGEYDLDVLLRFDLSMDDTTLGMARYGVWAFHNDGSGEIADELVGFWEVMHETHVSEISLLVRGGPHTDKTMPVSRAYTHTCLYSVNRNHNAIRWKSTGMIIRKLAEVFERGPAALQGITAQEDKSCCNGEFVPQPSNSLMLRLLPKLTWRIFKRAVSTTLTVETWSLGVYLGENSTLLKPALELASELKPPSGSFWADPFVVVEDGRIYLFVEEFLYRRNLGHIAVIELDDRGNYRTHYPVLQKNYHLSYPFVLQWDGEYYMVPENCSTNSVNIYRCLEFPRHWQHAQTLLNNVRGVDPTLFEHDGIWWMFLSQGSSRHDELCIYYSDSLWGPWRPHPKNPVKRDARSCRPAGKIFRHEGRLYRPAQDCSVDYGYAICINEIVLLSTEDYRERETAKILPTWRKGLSGVHMLNHASGVTVFDQKHRRLKLFA